MYEELFTATGGQNDEERANFGAKWGWYQSISELAGNDITRLDEITSINIHTAFTHLCYVKDKIEVEAKLIKKAYNK